jgi:hypothetical protein
VDEMGAYGLTVTVLATELAEAVMKDEAPEEGGFDLSAGLFGSHVSDWIRAVAKELEDRRAAPGWQPIETAPKDGTAVLGWDKDEGSDVMHFREGLWMQRVDDACWVRTPTHWRPLPPPPEV